MDFKLTEKQLFIQKMVRDFAENKLAEGAIERDKTEEFDVELYKEMGKMGIIGLPYDKKYGGSGEDYLSYAIAVEEISKVDGAMGIAYSVSTSLYAGSIMAAKATEEQKIKFLTPVLKGESLGAFGLTEPNAGSDAGGCITTAKREGDHYILNGLKCFSTNGPLADYYVVYALTEEGIGAKGLSAFVVETKTEGCSVGHIEEKCGIRSAQVSEIIFENCKIPAENLIGKEGEGFKIAMKTLDGGRIGVAAQGLGIAKGAFEIARKYLMQRKQFGKPLFKNQYLAFKMAELKVKIAQAEMMLYKAATDKSLGESYSQSAAMAKLVCTDTAMEVTTEAVQMLGGNGYMREYEVERMMRDAKITQIYEGTNEIQKLIISGSIFR